MSNQYRRLSPHHAAGTPSACGMFPRCKREYRKRSGDCHVTAFRKENSAGVFSSIPGCSIIFKTGQGGRPKRVFTRRQIYEAVWQEDYAVEDKTIAVHISNIHAKLRPSGTDGYIQTVWGSGFKPAE